MGGSGPSEQEWETVRSFVREGTDLLEKARSHLVSWREDPGSVSPEEFRDVAEQLEEPESGPLPPRDDVRSWEFDVTREDETWRVDGEELDDTLADLTSTMTATREICDDVADADGDPEELTEDQISEIDSLIDDIPDVVDAARGLLFGV